MKQDFKLSKANPARPLKPPDEPALNVVFYHRLTPVTNQKQKI